MEWNKIVSKETLCGDFEQIEQIVGQYGEAIIIQNNMPKYILKPFSTQEEPPAQESCQTAERSRRLTIEERRLLRRKLDSTGKRIFVTYYEHFQNLEDPLVFLAGEDFTEASKRARSSTARYIFRQGWELHALRYIIQTDRAAPEVIRRAQQILLREETAGTP